MSLLELVGRRSPPEPWAEGDNIPWHEPGFSRRMLREHLSQAHDAASRRFEIIDQHVAWIHHELLDGQPTRVLDLGCGPGLYSSRLARLGHTCLGIDYSPASIAYASEQAEDLACTFVHEDIRVAEYGAGFGLVMLIYGELNVFRPADARRILDKAHWALAGGGLLLLEPHTFAIIQEMGKAAATWYSSLGGLFSERPHLCLQENFWDTDSEATTTRYFVVDAASGAVTRYAQSFQAYPDEAYRALLAERGFEAVAFYPSLTGDEAEAGGDLFALTARK